MTPSWYRYAMGELGIKETPGSESTPRIIEYDACTTLKATDDSVAWCSAFVCWCLEMASIRSTRSAAARSYLDWGVVLSAPERGCIVVFKRGEPPSGHVCFFDHVTEDGKWACLGGNQSDQVKISIYDPKDVLGLRWPRDVQR